MPSVQAHARTSEGFYTAAVAALRSGCHVMRRFLGIADQGNESVGDGSASDDSVGGADMERDTEDFSFKREGGSGDGGDGQKEGAAYKAGSRRQHECAWKLLGDLYTYAHKLPPMCFVKDGAEGCGEERPVDKGTADAVAAQQVCVLRVGWLMWSRYRHVIRHRHFVMPSFPSLGMSLCLGARMFCVHLLIGRSVRLKDRCSDSGVHLQTPKGSRPVQLEPSRHD